MDTNLAIQNGASLDVIIIKKIPLTPIEMRSQIIENRYPQTCAKEAKTMYVHSTRGRTLVEPTL